jgi:hypothetical protein
MAAQRGGDDAAGRGRRQAEAADTRLFELARVLAK